MNKNEIIINPISSVTINKNNIENIYKPKPKKNIKYNDTFHDIFIKELNKNIKE